MDNGINNDEQVDKIEKIFTNVKKSMSETIKRTKSIDGKRKAKAIEKLDKVKLTIGYPKSLLDNEKLDSHYKWVSIFIRLFLIQLMKFLCSNSWIWDIRFLTTLCKFWKTAWLVNFSTIERHWKMSE